MRTALADVSFIPEALQYGAFGLLALVLFGGYLLLRHEMASRDAKEAQIVAERNAEREHRKTASERHNASLADARGQFVQALTKQTELGIQADKERRQDFLTALQSQQATFREVIQDLHKANRELQDQAGERWKGAVDAICRELAETTLTYRGLRDEVLLVTGSMKRHPPDGERRSPKA